MIDDNKDKEEQEGAVQPTAQEESGVTRNQWDGGPWPQEADGVATDADNHRMLEATRNRPENLTQPQTPDSHWDSVLSRQHAQDVEDVKLQRFAQNRAVIAQMIKDRDDRVNAEKAAVQAREDQFSALASLCYDPDYGQAFVDSGTLQAYNAQHQGEQGFNPITKMGRMTGGALFVERQIVDNNGRPVVEQFVDPKTGQTVRRPKIAVEAIGPKQFQARMQDFRDWQWDDVTKQFMNSGDFAKVQKSREDKARAELYQKQLDADPRLRMADTKMRTDMAMDAAKLAAQGGSGNRTSRGAGSSDGGWEKIISDTEAYGKTRTELVNKLDEAISQLNAGKDAKSGITPKELSAAVDAARTRLREFDAARDAFIDNAIGRNRNEEGEVEGGGITDRIRSGDMGKTIKSGEAVSHTAPGTTEQGANNAPQDTLKTVSKKPATQEDEYKALKAELFPEGSWKKTVDKDHEYEQRLRRASRAQKDAVWTGGITSTEAPDYSAAIAERKREREDYLASDERWNAGANREYERKMDEANKRVEAARRAADAADKDDTKTTAQRKALRDDVGKRMREANAIEAEHLQFLRNIKKDPGFYARGEREKKNGKK